MKTILALVGAIALIVTTADARQQETPKPAGNSTAIAGAAAAAKATATSSSRSSASAKQAQGQIQGQSQQQQLGQNITHNEARVAPGFSAPSLSASDEACMGSTSGGVGVTTGVIGVSATFGSTWESWNCNLRMFAQQVRLAGAPDAALLLLASHPEVRAALVASGRVKADPKPIHGPAQSAAPSSAAAARDPRCDAWGMSKSSDFYRQNCT